MLFDQSPSDRKVRQFILSAEFLSEFQGRQPKWGPVGHFTYARTYSRDKLDGGSEVFWETCKRVVEGTFHIQKVHCRVMGLPWSEPKAQKSAQDMFRRMWDFKFLPPGRGLWIMGTDLVYQKGGAAMNNCSFVTSSDIDIDFADPFCFLMDMSMLGVGVGGDCRGAGKIRLQMPRMGTEPFVVEDSREGWVELARTVLNSFVGRGFFPTEIDYSGVRPRGAPLKGFGGTASGAGPLLKLIENATHLLMPPGAEATFKLDLDEGDRVLGSHVTVVGEGEPYRITSTHIVDLFNYIGCCVVAGGIRRSSEIMFGESDDGDFIRLKQDQTALEDHRWVSNNSIFARVGMDYSEVAESIAVNGEPGLLWLDNAQKFSRMRGTPDNKDRLAVGVNPCSEQTLHNRELCTLVETFPYKHDSYVDYQRTLKMAYLYAKTVTLVPTHDARTNAVMAKNRRIGCSMSGITQAMRKLGRRVFLDWCGQGYEYIQELDRQYSDWLGIPLSIKTTSVKPSGCRPWYALTSTDQGILTLEDLFEDHPEGQKWADAPYDVRALQMEAEDDYARPGSRLTKTFDNGVSPVLRITTSYNIVVESTPDHQWWVKQEYKRGLRDSRRAANEWRRSEDIQANDILDIRPGVYNNEKSSPLDAVSSRALSMRGDAAPIKQPLHMNPRIAWMLGYMWGDGAMSPSQYRLRWTDGIRENLEKAQEILLSEFGLTSTVNRNLPDRDAGSLEVGSKHLWHWLLRNGVFKIYAGNLDVIPRVVRESSREDILAFMAGLMDADGCTSKASNDSVMIWTTADAAFAQHIQDVLLAVGIVAGRSHQTQGQSFQKRKSMWHLTSSIHSEEGAVRMLGRYSVKMQNHEKRDVFEGWRGCLGDQSGLILGKVLKVEAVGEMSTFDVEVADTHWYYAGAVKSHNTVSLLAGSTPGIHYPHSEFYIRNIRVAATSPLVKAAQEAGYPVEKDTYADDTVVVSFPVKEEHFTKGKAQVTIWEQFANAAALQRHWADNQVSITVSFKPEEADDIKTCLDVYEDQLKGLSLLPLKDHAYKQAPYIEITGEQYADMMSRVTPMKFEDATHEETEMFCTNDSCTIGPKPTES